VRRPLLADGPLTVPCSDVASTVADILNGASLYDVATWADEIRSDPKWSWSGVPASRLSWGRARSRDSCVGRTGPLHYADAPAWACDFVASRDCANSICVVGAIKNYTQRCVPACTHAGRSTCDLGIGSAVRAATSRPWRSSSL
jgi:hypothetical protein